MKPPWLLLLDALLRDELSGGSWRLFHDPNQDIFAGGPPAELEQLEQLATCYRLTQNCRNTREVAMATSILSGVALSETLVAEGPEVTELWYPDARVHEKDVLKLLRAWLDDGVAPEAITVLAPTKFDNSILASTSPERLPRPIVDVSQADSSEPTRFAFRQSPDTRDSSQRRCC